MAECGRGGLGLDVVGWLGSAVAVAYWWGHRVGFKACPFHWVVAL